jgi:predicted AlkP superfamily pyrophosphatase or phosphodiesterase
MLQSLRKAVGSIYGHETAMSINSIEWSATTGTQVQPAKFIVGVPTEVLANEDTLMTGVSSNNSAITLNIVSGTATSAVHNLHLILNYDALIHIDLDNGQAFLKR